MSIMQRGGGIASTVQATRELSFIHLRSKAEGLLKKMTAMGITTVEGKSGYGLNRETELLQLKVMRSLNKMRVYGWILCLLSWVHMRCLTNIKSV